MIIEPVNIENLGNSFLRLTRNKEFQKYKTQRNLFYSKKILEQLAASRFQGLIPVILSYELKFLFSKDLFNFSYENNRDKIYISPSLNIFLLSIFIYFLAILISVGFLILSHIFTEPVPFLSIFFPDIERNSLVDKALSFSFLTILFLFFLVPSLSLAKLFIPDIIIERFINLIKGNNLTNNSELSIYIKTRDKLKDCIACNRILYLILFLIILFILIIILLTSALILDGESFYSSFTSYKINYFVFFSLLLFFSSISKYLSKKIILVKKEIVNTKITVFGLFTFYGSEINRIYIELQDE